MKYIEDLIMKTTGDPVPPEALDEAFSKNGNPVRRIAERMANRHFANVVPEKMKKQVEDEFYKALSPLHPVFCFLREQRREKIQRAFEVLEAHIDRSTPPAPPEMPRFMVAQDEEQDAVYPEEVEEARKRKLKRRIKRRLKHGQDGR